MLRFPEIPIRKLIATVCIISGLASAGFAGTPTTSPVIAPRAARSVHLWYLLPDALKGGVTEFYAEVNVKQTVPGTYFQVCGFAGGYFGIQNIGGGDQAKKVGIFSVWDAADGDKKKLGADQTANILFTGDGVQSRRFHGEGTGAHTDFPFDWQLNTTYRFYLHSQIDGDRTVYDAWIGNLAGSGWKHVATLSAANGGKKMTGLYSFVEDFRRDTKSATEVRRGEFGNAWVRDSDSPWMAIDKTRFTATKVAKGGQENIDAGVIGDRFYMQTGGDTVNHTPVNSTMQVP